MRQSYIVSPEQKLFSINSQIHSHLGEKLRHLGSNISEAGSQEGEDRDLRVSSLFIGEACGRAVEQPSTCEWRQWRVAKQGQSPVESRDGGPIWEPGRQRASFQGRTEGPVRVRQGIGPRSPGVRCVPIRQQLSASKMVAQMRGQPKDGT